MSFSSKFESLEIDPQGAQALSAVCDRTILVKNIASKQLNPGNCGSGKMGHQSYVIPYDTEEQLQTILDIIKKHNSARGSTSLFACMTRRSTSSSCRART